MVAFIIAGGSWIFAIFLVVMLFGAVLGLYTLRGSGINKHPYHDRYSGAPGANREVEFSDFETFENQYIGRQRRRRHGRARS